MRRRDTVQKQHPTYTHMFKSLHTTVHLSTCHSKGTSSQAPSKNLLHKQSEPRLKCQAADDSGRPMTQGGSPSRNNADEGTGGRAPKAHRVHLLTRMAQGVPYLDMPNSTGMSTSHAAVTTQSSGSMVRRWLLHMMDKVGCMSPSAAASTAQQQQQQQRY